MRALMAFSAGGLLPRNRPGILHAQEFFLKNARRIDCELPVDWPPRLQKLTSKHYSFTPSFLARNCRAN